MLELSLIPGMERFGSVVMMLVFISVLIIAHELGHFLVARKCGIRVERFGFGLPFGPTLWSKHIGGVEYCIHACLFGGYVSFPDDDPEHELPADSPERFENASWGARFAVMIAGVAVNAVLGWALMFFVVMGWGLPTGEADSRVMIASTLSEASPAATAGFLAGDEIVSVAGQSIKADDYEGSVKNVQALMKTHSLQEIPVQVTRNGQTLDLTVQPNEKGLIGIQLGAVQRFEQVDNPITGAVKTTAYLGKVIQMQFKAFGMLFTGQMPMSELAGPIRIVGEGAKLIDQSGIQTGLMLTAIISIILAVMNLLPIPALDGGHILFLLIEALKGSPVKQEIREQITQYGFLGLLGLIAFILVNDINNTFINPPQ